MKPLTLLTCIFLLFSSSLTAQTEDKKLKELFLDAEYFFLNEDYGEALSNYLTIYQSGYTDNGNINYRIGQCYLKIADEKEKAIPYLEKAVQLANVHFIEGVLRETKAPIDAYFYLGNAYRINNQLDKAKECYTKYKSFYNKNKDSQRIALADLEIQACNFAQEQMNKPIDINAVNVGKPVSTISRDICPVVSGDMGSMAYITKQKFYDAVYFSRKQDDKWTPPLNITPEIQSDGDQYPTFLSYDGKELYLRQEDNFEADLLVSKNIDGVWTKSKSIGKLINSKYWEGNMSISKDGKTLYFSSNRKNSYGAMDIYRSEMLPDGEWGEPVNLGPKINTIFNEDAPYITEDGSRLYFISQGHQSMGGYDIFYCNISKDGLLSEPIHLGYPINTTDDDIFFYPLQNGQIAYTALSQKGNIGFEDIFLLDFKPQQKTVAQQTEAGQVLAFREKPDLKTDTIAPSVNVEETKSAVASNETPEEPIIIPTIFFKFNSIELTENSTKSLDYIYTVLKNYDLIKIQFIGYADAVGSDQYNLNLSEKRAEISKDYLVKKGVAPTTITTTGMGEKNAIAINNNQDGTDNPEGRKFNRRVDIKILEAKPTKKVINEDLKIPSNLRTSNP
jgi:outer membrane protein OmpA-like peptidoglycan-associated protein/tetratricopeptide (TPR) repeat protein